MLYAVGIRPATTVWAPSTAPLPPKAWSGRGIRPTRLRREAGNEPVCVKALALSLPSQAYCPVTWPEGSNASLSSRFAAVRVRPAHRDCLGTAMRAEQWLLIEWPEGEAEPLKYFLSTAPCNATLEQIMCDKNALANRARLSGTEAGVRARALSGTRLARVSPSRHAVHRRLRLFDHAAPRAVSRQRNTAESKTTGLPDDYIARGSRADTASCI